MPEMTEVHDPVDVDATACMKLFKQVVLQAFEDACATVPQELNEASVPADFAPTDMEGERRRKWAKACKARRADIFRAQVARDEARRWLTLDSEDFRVVCVCAGWEPEYIRRGAEALKRRGWIKPAGKAEKAAA